MKMFKTHEIIRLYYLDQEGKNPHEIERILDKGYGSVYSSLNIIRNYVAHPEKMPTKNTRYVQAAMKIRRDAEIKREEQKTPANNGTTPKEIPILTGGSHNDVYSILDTKMRDLQGAIENVIAYEVERRVQKEREKFQLREEEIKEVLEAAKVPNWVDGLRKKFSGGGGVKFPIALCATSAINRVYGEATENSRIYPETNLPGFTGKTYIAR